MKILVRNLSRAVTEQELFAMFEPFGTIEACDLVMDQKSGKSKGFGFIEMPSDQEANVAITKLNGKLIRGVKVRVKKTLH
jgi:RNA recognition motif-containing protein